MLRSLFKLALLLVVCIVIYNFFFGTDTEKEASRKIYGEARNVVVSISGLLRSEKEKFDGGKYDGLLDKLGNAYRAVRARAQHLDGKLLQRLDDLEVRKAQLTQDLEAIENGDEQAAAAPKKGLKKDAKAQEAVNAKAADQQRRKAQLQRELAQLLQDSDALMQQAEAKQ